MRSPSLWGYALLRFRIRALLLVLTTFSLATCGSWAQRNDINADVTSSIVTDAAATSAAATSAAATSAVAVSATVTSAAVALESDPTPVNENTASAIASLPTSSTEWPKPAGEQAQLSSALPSSSQTPSSATSTSVIPPLSASAAVATPMATASPPISTGDPALPGNNGQEQSNGEKPASAGTTPSATGVVSPVQTAIGAVTTEQGGGTPLSSGQIDGAPPTSTANPPANLTVSLPSVTQSTPATPLIAVPTLSSPALPATASQVSPAASQAVPTLVPSNLPPSIVASSPSKATVGASLPLAAVTPTSTGANQPEASQQGVPNGDATISAPDIPGSSPSLPPNVDSPGTTLQPAASAIPVAAEPSAESSPGISLPSDNSNGQGSSETGSAKTGPTEIGSTGTGSAGVGSDETEPIGAGSAGAESPTPADGNTAAGQPSDAATKQGDAQSSVGNAEGSVVPISGDAASNASSGSNDAIPGDSTMNSNSEIPVAVAVPAVFPTSDAGTVEAAVDEGSVTALGSGASDAGETVSVDEQNDKEVAPSSRASDNVPTGSSKSVSGGSHMSSSAVAGLVGGLIVCALIFAIAIVMLARHRLKRKMKDTETGRDFDNDPQLREVDAQSYFYEDTPPAHHTLPPVSHPPVVYHPNGVAVAAAGTALGPPGMTHDASVLLPPVNRQSDFFSDEGSHFGGSRVVTYLLPDATSEAAGAGSILPSSSVVLASPQPSERSKSHPSTASHTQSIMQPAFEAATVILARGINGTGRDCYSSIYSKHASSTVSAQDSPDPPAEDIAAAAVAAAMLGADDDMDDIDMESELGDLEMTNILGAHANNHPSHPDVTSVLSASASDASRSPSESPQEEDSASTANDIIE